MVILIKNPPFDIWAIWLQIEVFLGVFGHFFQKVGGGVCGKIQKGQALLTLTRLSRPLF